jgi:hypothetical protein
MAAASASETPSNTDVNGVDIADKSKTEESTLSKISEEISETMQYLKEQFISQNVLNYEVLGRFSKAKWISLTNLYYTLTSKGLPYGGVVRDYIIRTSAANSFYAYCKEHQINANDNYDNQDVHPVSFLDRHLLPIDIDIFITKKNFDELIKILKYNFYIYKSPRAASHYFFESCELFKEALTHEKWVIDLFSFPTNSMRTILFDSSITKKKCEISIDFIIINDDYLDDYEYKYKETLYPPFGNPDFDVNLLSFTIDSKLRLQISLLPYLDKLYNCLDTKILPLRDYETNKVILDSVITNIKNKRALPIFPITTQYAEVFGDTNKALEIQEYRIIKMLNKKFKIDFYNTILPSNVISLWEQSSEKKEDALCVVCKEQFTNENRAFNVCDSCPCKMHLACLRNFLEKENASETKFNRILCINCKQFAFKQKCPCQLINFIIKISKNVDNTIVQFDCFNNCEKRGLKCKHLLVNCVSCKRIYS